MRTLTPDFEFTNNVESIKQMIKDKKGIFVDLQHLIFSRREYKDNCTLHDINFWRESIVDLLISPHD